MKYLVKDMKKSQIVDFNKNYNKKFTKNNFYIEHF